VFGKYIKRTIVGLTLSYDGNPGGVLYIHGGDEITGVSINRPSDAAIYSLYDLACLVPSAFTWSENYAVAKEAYIPGIPDWLIKAFGHPPIVAHSADELIQAIARS
jgi:hypothetical protein